jgi:hypothetical protein
MRCSPNVFFTSLFLGKKFPGFFYLVACFKVLVCLVSLNEMIIYL